MITVLTARDIVNYYPSCDLEKSIEAVGQVLRNDEVSEEREKCLKEAVRITMTKNNIKFSDGKPLKKQTKLITYKQRSPKTV